MTAKGSSEGLREAKKKQTRQALSEATIALCIERGFSAVSIDEIAAAVGVSPRTFRNYFSGKAEAIAAVHGARMSRIAAALRAQPSDESLWQAIATALEAQFDSQPEQDQRSPAFRRWADGLRALLAEPAVHGAVLEASHVAQAELAAAVAARTGADPHTDPYPNLVAATTLAVSSTVVEQWLRSGPVGSVQPRLREAISLVEKGLPEPGRAASEVNR